jgi:hypothetical protein
MKKRKQPTPSSHFPSVPLADVVESHISKHTKVVSEILSDLEKLDEYSAIKINLSEIDEKKADLRSALHRAAKKYNMDLATTSDEQHLFVFRKMPRARSSSNKA